MKPTPLEEKEREVVEILSSEDARAKNSQVLPTHLLVFMAMALYSQYHAGVPITCTVALSIMLGCIEAKGLRNLIHSQQSAYPVSYTHLTLPTILRV